MPYKDREAHNACMRKIQKKKRDLRQAAIDAVKSKTPCKDCGKMYHPRAMEFDHLPNSNKIRNIAHMKLCSEEKFLDEISKCELVCGNCHAKRTRQRKGKTRPPTGLVKYIRQYKTIHCICSDCDDLFPWYMLQFDHVIGTKCFNLSKLPAGTTQADVDAEIKKCEIVCINCHAVRTLG